jgi:hypothetical protein
MGRQVKTIELELARDREQYARALARATERALAVQAGVADDITEGVRHERARATALAVTVADLGAVRGQLLHAVRELDARGPSDSPAGSADGGEATAGSGLVHRGWLVELYRGADEEAASLAAALDRSIGAGLLCERTYDSAQARLRSP